MIRSEVRDAHARAFIAPCSSTRPLERTVLLRATTRLRERVQTRVKPVRASSGKSLRNRQERRAAAKAREHRGRLDKLGVTWFEPSTTHSRSTSGSRPRGARTAPGEGGARDSPSTPPHAPYARYRRRTRVGAHDSRERARSYRSHRSFRRPRRLSPNCLMTVYSSTATGSRARTRTRTERFD